MQDDIIRDETDAGSGRSDAGSWTGQQRDRARPMSGDEATQDDEYTSDDSALADNGLFDSPLDDSELNDSDMEEDGIGSMSDPIGDPMRRSPGMDEPEVYPDHIVPPGTTTSRDLGDDDDFMDPAEDERTMRDDPLGDSGLSHIRRT